METQQTVKLTGGPEYPAHTMGWADIHDLHQSLTHMFSERTGDTDGMSIREYSPEIATSRWSNGERSIEEMIAAVERCQADLRLIGELIVYDNQALSDRRALVRRIVDQLKRLKSGVCSPDRKAAKRSTVSHRKRFFRSDSLNGDEVVYFFDYQRKCESDGEGREECLMSKRLRALKRLDKEAIRFFTGLLSKTLLGGFSVCVVPSHRQGNKTSGIKEVAVSLSRKADIADATDCLERFRPIKKQAVSHRKRNIDLHLQSVRIRSGHIVRGKDMLLLDDVGTSGWSMAGCRRILMDAGSARVKCAVLGRTVNKTGENVTDDMQHAVMVH